VFVLEHAPLQAAAHPGVKHSRFARHDVHEIAMALHSRSLDSAGTSLHEVPAPLRCWGQTSFPSFGMHYPFHSSIIFTKSLNR
jgi:hypothetical protein